jgi:hypothetical protein
MTVSKDSKRKGFNLTVSSLYDNWFQFKKDRPITAMILTEMFDEPEEIYTLMKKEFSELDMIELTPYTPYKPVKVERRCRIVDATFPENG